MSDFSCYITIRNDSAHALAVATPPPADGSWEGAPTTIAPRGSASFRLRDPSGPTGSEGGFVVSVIGSGALLLANFQDGYVQSNYCNISSQGLFRTMSWTFEGASGEPDNFVPGNVPGSGHPVYLNFTFTDPAGPGTETSGGEGATPG